MKFSSFLFLITIFFATNANAQGTASSAASNNAPDDFAALMKEYEGGYNQLMKQVTKITARAKDNNVSSSELTSAIKNFNTLAADYKKRLDNGSSVPSEQHYSCKMDMNDRLDKLSAARDHVVNAYVKLSSK
jgi:soluble cytochrome b562